MQESKTSTYGQNSLSFRGSMLWNILIDCIKSAQSTKSLKQCSKTGREKNTVAVYVIKYLGFITLNRKFTNCK